MATVLTLDGLEDPRVLEGQGVLERDGLVVIRGLPFSLEPGEAEFLTPEIVAGDSKNISYEPSSGQVGGTRLEREARGQLGAMMARYSSFAVALLAKIAPAYGPSLQMRRTSFRPGPVDTRVMSKRKDDRRLHVDAFPSNPNQGRRILRVFTNVHPQGLERVWEVAEDDFEAYARRWIAKVKPGSGGALLEAIGLTKGRRTRYDSVMLQLHDKTKLDDAWQLAEPKARLQFPPGSTWIVFTDSVLHAALSGQHAFEQTFYLPPDAMAEPARAPVRVLERLMGQPLV